MRPAQARKFAFALEGLIRSRTKGGGDQYARKCINEIADALTDPPIVADIYAEHDAAVERARAELDRRIAERQS